MLCMLFVSITWVESVSALHIPRTQIPFSTQIHGQCKDPRIAAAFVQLSPVGNARVHAVHQWREDCNNARTSVEHVVSGECLQHAACFKQIQPRDATGWQRSVHSHSAAGSKCKTLYVVW